MGEVVQLKTATARRNGPQKRIDFELLAIANRLDAVKGLTEFPRWLTALSGEIRRAARECKKGGFR